MAVVAVRCDAAMQKSIPFAINLISCASTPSFVLTVCKGWMELPDEMPALNLADDARIACTNITYQKIF